jgi:putative CocE/NonD family hydrolase
VGPWVHGGLINKDIFGEENDYRDLNKMQNQFLTALARDPDNDPLPGVPQVKYFMLGENRWYESCDWPPPEMKYVKKYLPGDGLIDDSVNGSSKARSYISDPANPVLVNNGRHDNLGCYDLTETEKRNDVLVYTTDILPEDLKIAGEVKLTFYAAVEALDTDFFATLTEVESDGRSMLRTSGMIRARFRNLLEKEELLTFGEVCKFTLSLGNVAANFRKGNHLRIFIAGQNFPEFDRNTQSGKAVFSDAELFPAKCTIFHDENTPATLYLPEI